MPYDPASASKKVEVAGPPPPPKVPTAVVIMAGSLASGAILAVLSLRRA